MTSSATIVAIATGPARGAVGIVRLSGPRALPIARTLAPSLPETPQPRSALVARFVVDGAHLDTGLVLYFRGPASFTGEDVVELHAHGSLVVLRALVDGALAAGARLAGPGEFSRRAVGHGRLDLAQAEAVAQLVDAESRAQAEAAARQLTGALSQRIRGCLEALADVRADAEGALDFPDEADGVEANIAVKLKQALVPLRQLQHDASRGGLVRRGATVVLYGPVNAGKSTLFNRLVGAERALVDPEPGTTRDTLEATLEWRGLGITLIDTAGLREAPGRLEGLGIARARAALASADVAVLVRPPKADDAELAAWRTEASDQVRLEALGKADLSPDAGALRVSGLTGEGVEALIEALVSKLDVGAPGATLVTGQRHADAITLATTHAAQALEAIEVTTLEVVAGELGLAVKALAAVLGVEADEALLDAVFARFCIGK